MGFQIVEIGVKGSKFVIGKVLDLFKDNISEFLLSCHTVKLMNFRFEDHWTTTIAAGEGEEQKKLHIHFRFSNTNLIETFPVLTISIPSFILENGITSTMLSI